ncbi:MAG: ribosome biogenesis GTPase YlqF [Mycoplasmoidaceae bacterium]
MKKNQELINWFPGHMQKAIRLIKEQIKIIDIIIQIVDSRSVNNSSNDDLINEIAPNKTVIKIALKGDLSDVFNNDKNVIHGSIKNEAFRKTVLHKINIIAKPKIDAMIKKGIVKPKIYLMVLGLPNVGKSSFINFIAKKSQLITSDRPGVTKKNTWLKINDQIQMMDTPGILFKKIKNIDTGFILTLIKCVKWDITPKYEVIKFAYNFYSKNYLNEFKKYFDTKIIDNFEEFLNEYCLNKKMLLNKNEYDIEKSLEKLYKEFCSGNICKVNYEK